MNFLLSLSLSLNVSGVDMEVKPIDKRASGQAFEVILKPPSPVSDAVHSLPPPPKRDISLEDIQNKLEAAEERRRVRHHREYKGDTGENKVTGHL